MMSRNYVKSVIRSGADSTLWNVSPLKAAAVTPLIENELAFSAEANIISLLRGNNETTIYAMGIQSHVKGLLNEGFPTPYYVTYRLDIFLANLSTVGTVTHAAIPFDSAGRNSTSIVHEGGSYTNRRNIFSTYASCQYSLPGTALNFYHGEFSLNFVELFGRPIAITGLGEGLVINATRIVDVGSFGLYGRTTYFWKEI
jgi:hypothetical protein